MQIDIQQNSNNDNRGAPNNRGPGSVTGRGHRFGRGFGRGGAAPGGPTATPRLTNTSAGAAQTGAILTEAQGWVPMLIAWLATLGFNFGPNNQPSIFPLGKPYPAAVLANSTEMLMVQDMAVEANPSTIATIMAAAGKAGAAGIVSYDSTSQQLTAHWGPPAALSITNGPHTITPNANDVLVVARPITNPNSRLTISIIHSIAEGVFEIALKGADSEEKVINALNSASTDPVAILTNARAQPYGKHPEEKKHLKDLGVPKYLHKNVLALQYTTKTAKELLVAGKSWNLGVEGIGAISLTVLPLPSRNLDLPPEGSYLLAMDVSCPNGANPPISLRLLKRIS
ncbi:hypothetical protein VaNZ11_003052 [Volvox africanus]|uniref:Uncharacterized protein n=1 Tax=Volvox africanus TaxID=51714 RepID=A0ABQ5RTC1_9CHLO|nr:hypothetical protein VaNZ11_003052 [Volvox africanus]